MKSQVTILSKAAILSCIYSFYTCICRCKIITCPGARDKLNFRQDKHIFPPNARLASKKYSAHLVENIFQTSYLAT